MTDASVPAPAAGPPLEWSVNPWRLDRARAAAATAGLALVWVLVLGAGLGPLTGAALALVSAAMLVPGVLPTRCRVDGRGVARRTLGWDERAWSDLQRARVSDRGLFVSPLRTPGWRDAYRALFLPVPAALAGRAALLDDLRRRLAEHGF